MSEKIVVGTDGSDTADKALAEAVRLASALGAELHVVTAGKAWAGVKIVGAPAGAVSAYGDVEGSAREAVVGEALFAARNRGVSAHAHTITGGPAEALLRVAEDVGATLIVVGNRGMSGGRRVLGSIPNTVSHEARCNVLIVATA